MNTAAPGSAGRQFYIGIDCGISGGVVVLSHEVNSDAAERVVAVKTLEFVQCLNVRLLNMPHLVKFLSPYSNIASVAVELPRSLPQSNSAMNIFNQGRNVEAVIQSVLSVFDPNDVYLINEASWVRYNKLTGRGKKGYRASLSPTVRKTLTLKRVPHEGLVDAYYIAKYLLTSLCNDKTVERFNAGNKIDTQPTPTLFKKPKYL